MYVETKHGNRNPTAFALNWFCGAQTFFVSGLPTLSLQTKSLFGQPWLWMSLCSEEGR